MMSLKQRMNNPENPVCLLALTSGLGPESELGLLRQLFNVNQYHDIRIKQVQGQWVGHDELAYVVELPQVTDLKLMQVIINIAKAHKQDEVWVLLAPYSNGHRRVYALREPDFKHSNPIGYFVPCTQSQAYVQSGWTFDTGTGQHYILKPIGEA